MLFLIILHWSQVGRGSRRVILARVSYIITQSGMKRDFYDHVLSLIKIDFNEKDLIILRLDPCTERFSLSGIEGYDVVCDVRECYDVRDERWQSVSSSEESYPKVLVRATGYHTSVVVEYLAPYYQPTVLVRVPKDGKFGYEGVEYPLFEVVRVIDLAVNRRKCTLASIFNTLVCRGVLQRNDQKKLPSRLMKVWNIARPKKVVWETLSRLADDRYYGDRTLLVKIAKVYRKILFISQLDRFHTYTYLLFGFWLVTGTNMLGYDFLYDWVEMFWEHYTNRTKKYLSVTSLPSMLSQMDQYGLVLAYPIAQLYAPVIPSLEKLLREQRCFQYAHRNDLIPAFTPSLERSPVMDMVDRLYELLDALPNSLRIIDVIHLPTQLHQVMKMVNGRLVLVPNGAHKAYVQEVAYPHFPLTLEEVVWFPEEMTSKRVVLLWAHLYGVEPLIELMGICAKDGIDLWLVGSMLGYHPKIYPGSAVRHKPTCVYGTGNTFANLLQLQHKKISKCTLYPEDDERLKESSPVYRLSRAVHDHLSGWTAFEELIIELRSTLGHPLMAADEGNGVEPLFSFVATNTTKDTSVEEILQRSQHSHQKTLYAKHVFDTGEVFIGEDSPITCGKRIYRFCGCLAPASFFPCSAQTFVHLRDRKSLAHFDCQRNQTKPLWYCPGFRDSSCCTISTVLHRVIDLSVGPVSTRDVLYWNYAGSPLDHVGLRLQSGVVDVLSIAHLASIAKRGLKIIPKNGTLGDVVFKLGEPRTGSRFLLAQHM